MRHVLTDMSQLSSPVVEVFHGLAVSDVGSFEFLRSASVRFYVHVLPKAGEVLGLWRKVGEAPVDREPRLVWYTCATAEIRRPRATHWHLWETSEPRFTVAPGDRRLRAAELGMVMSPALIVERAHTGQWSMVYPPKL
jgi:hypothetical protein